MTVVKYAENSLDIRREDATDEDEYVNVLRGVVEKYLRDDLGLRDYRVTRELEKRKNQPDVYGVTYALFKPIPNPRPGLALDMLRIPDPGRHLRPGLEYAGSRADSQGQDACIAHMFD